MTQPIPRLKGEARLKLLTESERAAALRMATDFFNASHYKQYGIDTDEVNDLITTFIADRAEKTCYILMVDEEPVGLLAALAAKNQFNKFKITAELIWWIDPGYRNFRHSTLMLDAYEYWAKEVQKAQICQLACLDEKLHKLYTRRGFTRGEFAYMKEIT